MQDGQGLIKKFLDYKPVTVLLINKVIESNPDTRVVDVIWETDNTLLMAYEVSVCAYLSMKYMAILHKNYNFTLFVWDNRGKLWSNMTKHRFNMRELKFYFEDKNDLKSIEQLSKSYVVYLNHFKYVLDFNFDEKWRERFGPKLARNLQYNLLENSISIQFQSSIKITLESNIRNIKLVNDKMEGVARVVRSGLMCKRPFKYEFPEYYEFVNNIDMSIDSYVDPVQAFLESSSQAQDENVLEESDRKTYEESVERSTDSEDDATFVELDITIRKPKKGIVYRKSDKYIEYTCGLGFGITNIIESTHKDQISGSEGATVESSGTEEATISLDETLKSIDETLNFIDQTLSSIDKKLTVLENNENLRDKSTDLSYKIPKSLDEKYNFLQKHTRSLTEKYNSLFKKHNSPDKTTDKSSNTTDNTPNTVDKPTNSMDKPTNSMDKRLIWSTDNYDEPIVRVILFDGPGVKYLLGQKRNYTIHFFSCMDNWQEITGKTLNLGTLRMIDRRGDEIRYPNIITHFTKFQLYVKPYAACHRIMYKEQEIWASREKGVITELDFLILQILENKVNLYFRDKTVKRFKLSNGQISLISKGNSTYKQH
ncbi:hypothetical protein TpMuguga_01g00684 [Theileria parva strain Muguga]|uniref:Uncharacterized protein n=1 Tax=Theileria parva TaxID=5875 RepID=Q4N7Y6_THEPA|nr:uncharacterized protein TpMuguga_01g00684 [Theileria parva strain Muguga]EAN33922.1 hypothetical protein TpMuguga_01g00684 [Theileria parva strain Muguga]|eukprot:XP_766205.1 hypothetical protein [Theileria parva strain Muguga]